MLWKLIVLELWTSLHTMKSDICSEKPKYEFMISFLFHFIVYTYLTFYPHVMSKQLAKPGRWLILFHMRMGIKIRWLVMILCKL